jgi:phosphoenolpyruvate carboxylase
MCADAASLGELCSSKQKQLFSCMQTVEIVLTAHPTQVNRRTLQYKHSKIAQLLQYNDR